MSYESNVRRVVPYTPGEQPKLTEMIKLNTNENPYPSAPSVQDVLRGFNADVLRMYPDPLVAELRDAIADYYGMTREQTFVGVGSDDVLAMVFMTFFNSDVPILFPDITYSFYDVWAQMLKIPYEQIPLDREFRIRISDYQKKNGGIIFPNPNAPTGELMTLDAVEAIVKGNPDVVVVVDEAYIDFGGQSALALVPKYENLLVVQTFSKSRSLAGSRIGYCFGHEKLISYLNDVKYSFNSYTMDALTIKLGTAAVRDREYFEKTTAKIVETREWTKRELSRLGFVFGDSQSNFIFATHPEADNLQLFEALREAHIFVRHFSKPERINPYLRISIGTDEEMRRFIAFVENYLSEN